MTQKVKGGLTFKQAWTFPYELEKRITEFVVKHPGIWLHAPAGISKLGKLGSFDTNVKILTLDIDPSTKPDIVGNLYKLKDVPQIAEIIKLHGGFDGVISDPVWLKIDTCDNCKDVLETEKGLAYPTRRKISYSVRDILKPGGWWLFNGLWIPEVKGLKLTNPHTNPMGTPIEIPIQNFSSFRNVSLLEYLQRKNEALM